MTIHPLRSPGVTTGLTSPEINKDSMLIIGIDFGSTTSRCTMYYKGNYKSLPPVPSYVGFDSATGKLIFGRAAQEKYHLQEQSGVVYNLKQAIMKDQRFSLGPDSFMAVALVAQLLRGMKVQAEQLVGRKVSSAVITVPSFFSELHKGAVKDAALMTGLAQVTIVSEPTAALIWYRDQLAKKNQLREKNVLLLDSGGLTTDATLCKIHENFLQVMGSSGDNQGGCHLVDQVLVQIIADKLTAAGYQIDLPGMMQLKVLAEGAKIQFAGGDTLVMVPVQGGEHYQVTLSAAQMISAHKSYLRGVIKIYEQVKLCGKVDQVLLIGGPFQSSYIRSKVSEHITQPIVQYADQGFTVSRGAARYGVIKKSPQPAEIRDVIPMAIGIQTGRGTFSKVIPQNAPCPATYTKKYTTQQDNQTRINLNIYQGNRLMTKDCYYLGSIVVDEIPPMEKGVPQIEVSLSLSEQGLLQVVAHDRLRNISSKKIISAENRLDELKKKYLDHQFTLYRPDESGHYRNLTIIQMAGSWVHRLRLATHLSPKLKAHLINLTHLLEEIPVPYLAVEKQLAQVIARAQKEWHPRYDLPMIKDQT